MELIILNTTMFLSLKLILQLVHWIVIVIYHVVNNDVRRTSILEMNLRLKYI